MAQTNQSSSAQAGSSADYAEWIQKFSNLDLRRLEIRTKRRIDSDLIGRFQSTFRGSGVVFHELREYQPGDDVRAIHWKASARSQRTYVKSFVEDRSLNVLLLCDISASTGCFIPHPTGPRQESRGQSSQGESIRKLVLELAALITLTSYRSDDALGLALFADGLVDFLKPKRSRSQLHRILSSLAAPRELPRATNLGQAIADILPLLRRRSVVFILSDLFTSQFEQQLRQLSSRHDVILTLVSPAEYHIPEGVGLITVRDAESGLSRVVDTSSRKVIAALKGIALKRLAELEQLAFRCGADFMLCEQDPVRSMQKLMNRRARRIR